MEIRRIYLLPIFNFIWFATTLAITYVLAFRLEHIYPIFPLVSDIGSYHPERCFFAQTMNIGSLLMTSIVYIRYAHVKQLSKIYGFCPCINLMNFICLWLGVLTCFGVNIFANFQQSTVRFIHFLGVFLGFGAGTIYQVAHTLLCVGIYERSGSLHMNRLRAIITFMNLVSFILFPIFLPIKRNNFDGNAKVAVDPNSKVYVSHIISAIAQWNLIFCNVAYLLTFAYEFRRITLHEPAVEIQIKE